jgi:hypothetical protein
LLNPSNHHTTTPPHHTITHHTTTPTFIVQAGRLTELVLANFLDKKTNYFILHPEIKKRHGEATQGFIRLGDSSPQFDHGAQFVAIEYLAWQGRF